MPELPEVEHVVRYLRKSVLRARITKFEVLDPRVRRRPVTRPLEGSIRDIRRRGKLILIDLGKKDTLVFHLKLTGKLFVVPKNHPISKWTRLTIHLGKTDLRFEDMRRFGWFDVVDAEMRGSMESEIGPEPLEPEFTLEALRLQAKRRRGPVKPVLLDPAFVAGIGNIYADEILHAARLHPLERVESLTDAQWKRVHASIVSVLSRAVRERKGTPDQDRVGAGGKTAARRLTLAVFQKMGEPCPRCKTPIERLVVRGRGTHVCPRCQPLVLATSAPRR
jgi:formamidopyrimidine-DNA glycosylase